MCLVKFTFYQKNICDKVFKRIFKFVVVVVVVVVVVIDDDDDDDDVVLCNRKSTSLLS